MKKSTQTLLLVAGGAALLYYMYSKAKPNADMGGQNFGVKPCGGEWCCPSSTTPAATAATSGG